MSHPRPGRSVRRLAVVCATTALALTAGPATLAHAAGPRLVPTDRPMWVPGVVAGKLHAIDPQTGLTERTVPGNKNPMIVAPSPDGNTLYVVNLPKAGAGSGISFVDATTGASTFLKFPGIAAAEVLDNAGRYLYAVDIVFHQVVKIDTRTRTIVKRITFPDHLADEPLGIEISPDDGTLYIAWLGGWLGAYDATTGATIHQVKLPKVDAAKLGPLGQFTLPGWVVLSPDGTRLYALNFATGNTSVWDTRTWTDIGEIDHGPWTLPVLASFSPDGSKLYFTNYGNRQLQVVDTTTLKTIKSITLSGRPIGVATESDGTVAVGVINSAYNVLDPVTPILALLVVGGLTPLQNVHLGDGRILRYSDGGQQLLSTTAIHDTVPGAFVAPPTPQG